MSLVLDVIPILILLLIPPLAGRNNDGSVDIHCQLLPHSEPQFPLSTKRIIVWNAWTDPKQVKEWWGSEGCDTRVAEQDFREGERWRYVMVGPNGTEYPFEGTFLGI